MIAVEEFTKHSINNANAIEKAGKCSCYFCIRTFDASEIEEWITDKDGYTGLCPRCTVDALVPGEIDKELLAVGCKRWFTGVVNKPEENA